MPKRNPKVEATTYAEEEVEFASTVLYNVKLDDLTEQEISDLYNAAGFYIGRVKVSRKRVSLASGEGRVQGASQRLGEDREERASRELTEDRPGRASRSDLARRTDRARRGEKARRK